MLFELTANKQEPEFNVNANCECKSVFYKDNLSRFCQNFEYQFDGKKNK